MRFSTFLPVAALVAAVAAVPSGESGQCNTGTIQCCESTTTSSDPVASLLLGLIGVVVGGVDVPIGLTCSPVSVVGSAGSACSQAPLCCNDVKQNGLIGIGCSPVDA